ncbi:MAG: cytochrome b N-terminal domain-containing protein [Alphaproteobacteria bacterium]|nr:MAG: cytochrome b N-terminal domain-containing protein [Alphaproteobacteria bacterium]
MTKHPGILAWWNQRLPVGAFWQRHVAGHRVPRNLNPMWSFGAAATLLLLVIMFSGFVLALHLRVDVDQAFDSVQRLVREVPYGWLMRSLHAHGVSFLFFAVTAHMLRGVYYGSFKPPREVVWIIGVVMGLVMLGCAFTGAVLSWSQTGYWSATVVTDLASVLPGGDSVVTWLRGGETLGTPTLQRFFVLHLLLPFLLLFLLGLHIWAIHAVGSNNPTGIEPRAANETKPFFPNHLARVGLHLCFMMMLYAACVFFWPEAWNDPNTLRPADPMQTPAQIAPAWYLRPYFAMLRAVPDKALGALALLAGLLVPLALPWLDRHPVRSGRYRPWFRACFAGYVAAWLALIWAGGQEAQGAALLVARLGTAYVLGFFLVMLPLLSRFEKVRPIPASLTQALKGKKHLCLWLLLAGGLAPGSLQAATTPTWPHLAMLGSYDRVAIQRGWQVYRELCSNCPALAFVTYRHLTGLGYDLAQARAFARRDAGGVMDAPLRPMGAVYDPVAARAANLSLIVRTTPGGEAAVFRFLIGQGDGLSPILGLAEMPMSIGQAQMAYADATPATPPQMAYDLVAFLAWAADPNLDQRHRLGLGVMIFLVVFSIIFIGRVGLNVPKTV